jgi:hypothetical protein
MAGRINLKLRAHFFNKIGRKQTFAAAAFRGYSEGGDAKLSNPTLRTERWRAILTKRQKPFCGTPPSSRESTAPAK